MAERTPCMVPHCRRTTKADDPVIEWPDDSWICADHWRSVPRKFKNVKRRCRRALRRNPASIDLQVRFIRISKRCSRAAIEGAVGI